jgi:DNA-directed RNA polymerase alpha subunit
MATNGGFLTGHHEGFIAGADAGWKAGYQRALRDTGAAPIGPTPELIDVEYVPPVKADLNEKLADLRKEDKISVRAFNCLNRESIYTIGDLANQTEADLWDIRNIGQKTVDEIKALLASRDLELKGAE